MSITSNRSYTKPDASALPAETVSFAFDQVVGAINAIDVDMQSIFDTLPGKAPVTHNHTIAQITGLQTALNAKMASTKTFTLNDLTDVDTSGSVENYVLVFTPTGWVPLAPLSVLGAHGHAVSDIGGLQGSLNAKEPTINAGTTAQYWRGDKSWQTLNATAVGLGSVNNTADTAKPVSTAQQTALDGKANTSHTHVASNITDLNEAIQDMLATFFVAGANMSLTYNDTSNTMTVTAAGVGFTGEWGGITGTLADQTDLQTALNGKQAAGSYAAASHTHTIANITSLQTTLDAKEPTIAAGTTAQYWRGDKSWQTLNATAVGLGSVNNTADTAKPVSTAQQTALDGKASLAGATFTGGITGTSSGFTGTVQTKTASGGGTTIEPGNATVTGYLGFYDAAGVRSGYIGYSTAAGLINYVGTENGRTGHNFTGTMTVSGAFAGAAISGTSGTFSSVLTAGQNFISSTAVALFAPTGAGSVYIRPAGSGSNTNELVVTTTAATIGGNAIYHAGNKPFVKSSQLTMAASGKLSFAHGLGAVPDEFGAYLICITAQYGYVAGDVINVSSIIDVGASRSAALKATSTSIDYSYSSIALVTESTGAYAGVITPANWKLILTAKKS